NMLSTWRPEEEDDCCQWSGVRCNNQTGHVTALDLYNYGLGGEISLSLLNLTYLSYLDLFYNSFHGTFPKFICSMTQLTSLRLSNNKFTGTIPESIGNMTQLTYLDLSENKFSGTIPISIGSLTSLTYLDLSVNIFSGTIPMSIGSLTKLTWLVLSDNSFYGTIPREFGNLTNLEYLYLDSLGSCRVENLDWLSSLSSLEVLKMDGTSLAKANNWVNVIIGLQNLYSLSLVGCDLSHVMHPYSSSVNSSSSINWLFLYKTSSSPPMYSWLCPLFGKKLEYLVISGNKFDGNLSDFLNTLSTSATTLETLDASSNQFTGSLSDEIQNFSFLKTLNLSLNQLNGTISDKLWQLPNLQTLYLSSSSLSNDDVSNLSQSIQVIDFSSNKLGPRFPKWIQTLKNLIYLDLSNNSISDTVSTEYWNRWKSSQLSYLDLSFNNISGKLPKSLSNHDLDFIDLSFNCFYGPIPAFPARISFLDLSRNKFSWRDSLSCANCFVDNSYIDHLLIEWQGKVNEFSSILGLLKVIDLSSNNLTGQIPNEVTNLHGLLVLDLSDNSLDGKIPRDIGQMTQLLTLNLSRNMLSGEIPPTMSEMTLLNNLDMSFNDLSGRIPLGTQLQTFNASAYIGNAGLCGRPLPNKCSGDEDLGVPPVGESDGDGESTDELQRWFYIGGATGLGVCKGGSIDCKIPKGCTYIVGVLAFPEASSLSSAESALVSFLAQISFFLLHLLGYPPLESFTMSLEDSGDLDIPDAAPVDPALEAGVLPKFDMHLYRSSLNETHVRCYSYRASLSSFLQICKQGHWFSFQNRAGKGCQPCLKDTPTSLKKWKDKFFLVDRRAAPIAMAWRHHDSSVADPFPRSSEYNTSDVAKLREVVISLRRPPLSIL
ncbi:leucine-rich repeat-containing protein, partial [Tanacetum coccineum]